MSRATPKPDVSSRRSRLRAGGEMLELVDETVAEEVNVEAVHDVIARLLVAHWHRSHAAPAPPVAG